MTCVSDAAGRLAYLAETVDLLWPGDSGGGELVVLPHERAPRLLAPVRPRRAAAAATIRYTAQQGQSDRLAAAALGAALLAGYARTRPAVRATGTATGSDTAESVDDLLSRVLGEPVVTTLALTAARPNRKPVLQVFDRRGRTRAFVKIGVTPLARRLVDAEAANLALLAGADLRAARIPRVLHHAQWRNCAVLVLDALPMGRPLPRSGATGAFAPLIAAMREVSSVGAAPPGSTTTYLQALLGRAARVGGPWPELVAEVAAHHDVAGLPTGAWHGDWTAWNCARQRGTVLVWDWERFTAPAPPGFDLLHYVLNDAVDGHPERLPGHAADLPARASQLLRPWGLAAPDARTVALLYVLDLALRYVADSTLADRPGLRVEDWAPSAVRAALAADHRPAS